MSLGILSHNRAKKVPHNSIAMPEIQDRRANTVVPGGRRLHDYANLYINARNKMLYKRRNQHADLCILCVDVEVLNLPGVVITDRNASSCDYVRFSPAPDGLRYIDKELVFARYWTHPGDPIEEMRHGSIICAEVLVPDRVNTKYINGAYVSGEEAKAAFEATGAGIPVTVNSYLFFR